MKRFIFTERNGIYIIDLQQSLSYIDRAYEFIKQTVAHGGTVLFIGTKKQAQEAIAGQSTRVGMPYVNQRWLGGMLTNFQTVYKRLQRLKELEAIEQTGGQTVLSKKEALLLSRERIKLARTLGGLREMTRVPSAVWIVDTKKEHIAVGEARKLGIPVVAILDTNCDPDEVDYPIPGNDDAIRSVDLLTRVVADAVAEGLMARAGAARGDEKPATGELATDEPLADWERELLEGSTAARRRAAPAEAAGRRRQPPRHQPLRHLPLRHLRPRRSRQRRRPRSSRRLRRGGHRGARRRGSHHPGLSLCRTWVRPDAARYGNTRAAPGVPHPDPLSAGPADQHHHVTERQHDG